MLCLALLPTRSLGGREVCKDEGRRQPQFPCPTQSHTCMFGSPHLCSRRRPHRNRLLLLGQPTQGDQGAKDLLDVIFPDPNNEVQKVSPCLGERPGGIVTRNTQEPPGCLFAL